MVFWEIMGVVAAVFRSQYLNTNFCKFWIKPKLEFLCWHLNCQPLLMIIFLSAFNKKSNSSISFCENSLYFPDKLLRLGKEWMRFVHLPRLWSCCIRHWLSVTNLSLSLKHFRSFLEVSVDYINSKCIIWQWQSSSLQWRVSHCWSSHMALALWAVNAARRKRKTHNTTHKLCFTCFSALFPIPGFLMLFPFSVLSQQC